MLEAHPPGSRTRRRLARFAALVLALVAAVVVAELAVRATDPFGISYYRDNNRYFSDPGAIRFIEEARRPDGRLFENRPGADVEMATFRFTIDADGLRTGPSARAAGGATFLFLGDSVTLGWGVDDEHTWVRTLEREGRTPDGGALRCLNAGHLQYNTIQEADWLRAHGARIEPDVVVVTFLVNDVEVDHWAVFQGLLAELSAGAEASRTRATLRRWLRGLFDLARYLGQVRADGAAVPIDDVRAAPGYAEGWARCAAALEAIRATCAELGATLVVQDHTTPTIPDLAPWCQERGVPLSNLTFTDAELTRDLRNSAADAHANELGNRLLADKALAGLRAAGLVAPAEDDG